MIKRIATKVKSALEESGEVEFMTDEEKAMDIISRIISEYENRVVELERRATRLVEERISQVPDADYRQAVLLVMKQLAEKERLPL